MAGIKDVKLLIIGDEILMGQTVDTNSAWIGRALNEIGIELIEILTVRDKAASIFEGLERVSSSSDLVLVTGGLGPTEDDITKQSIAEFFNDELVFDRQTYDHIKNFLKSLDRKPIEAHREQACMPSTADHIHNDKGTAPGMKMKKDGKTYIFMPGVPYEMKSMMEREVLPMLRSVRSEQIVKHLTFQTFGLGESEVAERVKDITDDLPESLSVAFLPHLGRVRIRVTARGSDEKAIDRELQALKKPFSEKLGDHIFAWGQKELEQAVGEILKEKSGTMACAESCTGGYVAGKITSVPGASEYFMGSAVTYSNASKINILGVSEDTLEKHGAVSEQTAVEMVKGACERFGADFAVSTTGIAGPGGGTEEKPVGTVWVAAGTIEKVRSKKLQLGNDRQLNVKMSGDAALNLLRLFLSGS